MANLVAGTMSPSLSKTGDEGSGTLYHVVGSILRGMEYLIQVVPPNVCAIRREVLPRMQQSTQVHRRVDE